MSSVHVRSISTLDDVRKSFLQFGEQSEAALQASVHEIQRTYQWLEERYTYWSEEHRRQKVVVSAAYASMVACQVAAAAGAAAGASVSCNGPEMRYLEALKKLAWIEDQLKTIAHYKHLLDVETDRYRAQYDRMKDLLATNVPKAAQFLALSAEHLRAYAAQDMAVSSAMPFTGSISFSGSNGAGGGTSSGASPGTSEPSVPVPSVLTGRVEVDREVDQRPAPERRDGGPGGIERG